MAYAITNTNPIQDFAFMGVPSGDYTQADLTLASATVTTSTVFLCAPNAKTFRARVWIKTVTGTGGFLVELQTTNDADGDFGETTGTNVTIDAKYVNVNVATTSSWAGYFLELTGSYPLASGATAMQLVFTTGSGTAGVADIEIQAA